jgi:hypothetical protein
MAETLRFTFRTAQDQRTAGKLDETEPVRLALLQEVEILRRVADDIAASVRDAPRHIADTTDLSQFLADASTRALSQLGGRDLEPGHRAGVERAQ